VRHFSPLGTGATSSTAPACRADDRPARGPEPNDSPASGGTPTAVAADCQVAGTISTPGDADWYVFTLPTRAGFIATVADGGAPPQLLDAQLRLLRENPPGSGTFVQVGDIATRRTASAQRWCRTCRPAPSTSRCAIPRHRRR